MQMKIIFNNLLTNAFKFINPYKETPIIVIRVKPDPNQVTFEVEDNGMGIPEAHLSKIFQMFYRTTDKKPGSGIGLYIVMDCIRKLNGNVKVESKVGEGSRFICAIPNLNL